MASWFGVLTLGRLIQSLQMKRIFSETIKEMSSRKPYSTIAMLLLPSMLFFFACNVKPTDPGKAKGNVAPETFISPTPPEGSENNPFRLRLQWRGNDSDGRVKEYQYRLDGPLFNNTWESTPNFYQNFKLRNGWYTLQVRSVDDNGAVDETPAARRFHVLGPTFDKGILVIDDDKTIDDEADDRKDMLMDSLMIRAGFTKYTFWDYEKMFGITEQIAFTGKGVDLTGQEYNGLSAFSSIIWYTGTGGENNLSKNERLLVDYMDMGGNLWVSGTLVMMSMLGDTADGSEIAPNALPRKYLKIRRAKAALIKTDMFLSRMPGYVDLDSKYIVPTSGLTVYLENACDQLVPEAEGEILYSFSNNVWVDDRFGQVQSINSEEYAGNPIAIRYRSETYKSVVCGFPLVRATKRGRRYQNNIMNEDQMVGVVRQVLMNEFGEIPQ